MHLCGLAHMLGSVGVSYKSRPALVSSRQKAAATRALRLHHGHDMPPTPKNPVRVGTAKPMLGVRHELCVCVISNNIARANRLTNE